MTYARTQQPRERIATLVVVGALHVVAAVAIVKGLSFAWTRPVDVPQLAGTNTPLPKDPVKPVSRPHAAEHQPTAQPTFTAVELTPFKPVDINPDWGRSRIDDGPIHPIQPIEPTRPTLAPRLAQPLGNPGSWVTPEDYPSSDLRLDHAGAVGFTLAVSAEGRVTACTVTRSSTFAGLDSATCALLTRRAKFRPATGDQGEPVAGTYSSTVRWEIPE